MDETMKRLYFGMGKNDHVLPQKIIGKINDVTRSKNIPIGRIDLFGDFSYVDVEESFVPMILECFSDPRKNPKGIVVEVAKEQPKREKKSHEEKKEQHDEVRKEETFEKKSKKKSKEFDDEKPKYKVERSRDGHEWLDPDWREHLDDIDVFLEDEDVRPSRKKRNEERGFGAKKEKSTSTKKESKSSSKKESRSAGAKKTSRSGGFRSSDYDVDGPRSNRGRRGAARNEEPSYYSPKRRGGKRR